MNLDTQLNNISDRMTRNARCYTVEAMIGYKKYLTSGSTSSPGSWTFHRLGYGQQLRRLISIMHRDFDGVSAELHDLCFVNKCEVPFDTSSHSASDTTIMGKLRLKFPSNYQRRRIQHEANRSRSRTPENSDDESDSELSEISIEMNRPRRSDYILKIWHFWILMYLR